MSDLIPQHPYRWQFVALCIGIWLCSLLPIWGEEASETNSLIPDSLTAQLDSLHTVSTQYEAVGNYQLAYTVERRRMELRDSLRLSYLNQLISHYEETFYNEDLEMTRVRLRNQNIRMEVDQMESEREMNLLREEQDSINIENSRIQLYNATAQEEIAEKNRQLQEDEMVRRYEEQRRSSIMLWVLVTLMIVVLGFCIYFVLVRKRSNALLRREREVARAALKRAEVANHTQNHFMQQLNEGIQQPAEDIWTSSAQLCADCAPADSEAVMEDIRRKTSMLLHRLGEIADQCNESATTKTLTLLLLLGLSFAGKAFIPTAQAQHNSYGIADEYYQYYKRCDRMVQDPAVVAMTDTLFEMGGRTGDRLTQCLAFNVRVGHAYFTHNIDSIREEQRKLYEFVSQTPYTDQLYLGWNRIIIHYLDNNMFYEAMTETLAYQRDALRLNNSYGVARSYYYLGEVYRLRGMHAEAIRQYNNAIKYQEEHQGSTRIQAAACTRIGEICIDEDRYNDAEKYLRRALKTVNYDYEAVNPTIELFRLYVKQGDLKRADLERKKIEQFRDEDLLIGTRVVKYTAALVHYHLLHHDYVEALQCAESIADKDPETLSLAKAAVGYYEEALLYLRLANEQEEQTAARLDVSRLLSYQSEYDSKMIEKQNDLLKLRQSQLRLEQLQNEQELATEQNRRDSIALHNQLLQQQAIEQAGQLRETELAEKRESLKHAEQTTQYQHRILWLLVLLMLIVLVCLLVDVWWRRRSTKILKREVQAAEAASLAAEEATERKRRFMLQMSHEIRTPLNTIIGFNEILSDPTIRASLSEEDLSDLRRRCAESTAAFEHLIRSTLSLCRVESGAYIVEPVDVALKAAVQQVVQKYSSSLKPGVHLNVISDDTATTFRTDRNALGIILSHLLDNACKFTTEGSITIDYRLRYGRLYLMVSDTGCGVPKEQAEGIFAHFAKLNEFVPGIGLGLSLCRSLIKMLHGTIELDTEYTEGCRFVVTLQPIE
jgi:signal transduction histidine kinase